MFTAANALPVDSAQKQVLESLARAGSTPQLVARKCKAILLASEGTPNNAIAQQTGLSRPTVIATRATFVDGGVEAIRRRQKRERSRRVLTPELEQRIPDTTLKTRPPHPTHWSYAPWPLTSALPARWSMECGSLSMRLRICVFEFLMENCSPRTDLAMRSRK